VAGPGGVNLLHGGHLIAGAAPSFAAGNCSTTASVTVRSGPGTGYPLAGKEPAGAQFTLQCQWQGGISVNGNATWDKVTVADGVTGAITDDYTTTTSRNSYAPGTGALGPGSASPPPSSIGSLGGVDMHEAAAPSTPAGASGPWQPARTARTAGSAQARAPRSASMSPPNAGPSTATAQYPRPATPAAPGPGTATGTSPRRCKTPPAGQSPRRTRLIPPGAIISGTTGADGASSSPSKPRASSLVILPPSRIIRRS
jgi:hypothetical protein